MQTMNWQTVRRTTLDYAFLTLGAALAGVEHRAAAGAQQDRIGRRDGHCDAAAFTLGMPIGIDGADHQHPVVYRRASAAAAGCALPCAPFMPRW